MLLGVPCEGKASRDCGSGSCHVAAAAADSGRNDRRPSCGSTIPSLSWQVKFLAHIRHKHIVPFVGSCDANNEQILVFDFLPNGSLSSWLRPEDGEQAHCCPMRSVSKHC